MKYVGLLALAIACLSISALAISILTLIMHKARRSSTKWLRGTVTVALVATVSITAKSGFLNPLPSDDYLIRHFTNHRAEYESLASSLIEAYAQSDESLKAWLISRDVLDLKIAIKARDERNTAKIDQFLQGVRANTGVGRRSNEVHSIIFSIQQGVAFSWREFGLISKEILYFVSEPLSTEGGVNCPRGSGRKCFGDSGIEILGDLDGFPPFPGSGIRTCGVIYRRIDAHWFLQYSKACS